MVHVALAQAKRAFQTGGGRPADPDAAAAASIGVTAAHQSLNSAQRRHLWFVSASKKKKKSGGSGKGLCLSAVEGGLAAHILI